MASDRENSFQQAERLLRAGKVQPAVEQLDGLVRGAPRDLLLLNRCGDLLARMDQPSIAIQFYERLADQYADGGFLPKAIAIHKKALKLDTDRAEVLVKIGELYMTQEHAGEARSYLLRAAERHLNDGEFPRAREVYERLVAAEPDDPRHRVRLAESRAAEGETERAGQELLVLGHSLLESGRAVDAERAYQRAGELMEDSFEGLTGRAFSLVAQERLDEALSGLESGAEGRDGELAGVRAALLEVAGRPDDAARALEDSAPAEAFEVFLRWMLKGQRGKDPDAAWARLDAVIESRDADEDLAAVLSRLSRIEADGHLPALERLYRFRKRQGNVEETGAALEGLIQGLRAHSMDDEAARFIEQLKEIAPQSSLLESEPLDSREAETPPAPEPVDSEPTVAPPSDAVEPIDETDWVAAEAPAVPLAPVDEEFVKGHLTEAEVLQKYGLASEALQRLRTVTSKFPGHVEAQVKLAGLVRAQGNRAELAAVLFRLALARRASGDTDGAREAAREAGEQSPLPADHQDLLRGMGLISGPVAAPVETTPSSESAPVEEEAPAVRADAQPATPEAEAEEEDVEIVFGAEPTEDETPAAEPPAQVRVAPAEVLQEIKFYREQGMHDEARAKVAALRTLAFGGPELDALEADLGTARTAEPADAPDPAASVRLEGDDLTDLTAVLGSDLTEAEVRTGEAPEGEESLEDVFAAFKRQVEDEVGSEDFRTHYDLGIAYKEMGLLNDALNEFEVAAGSPELFREACSMAALCQRQRGEAEDAVRWYEKALEAPGGTREELQGLQYDMADALLQQGKDEAALDLFQSILDDDPGYRDVQSRVTDLQSQRGS